ncbi:10344_t:CDS:1 [Scutellospora calospora]|uniref:10344_t:CDS:1 n=1 Tax=Scutellospora calospora TaxID=85575 RepID=A0ACA9KHW4_9GLOM|nr:10344_t:CDS:1 [Scutellospora calospora]
MFLINYNPSSSPQPNLTHPNSQSREMTRSNELEILSNINFPLEFPTNIETPDNTIGQQILDSNPASIQQMFQQNMPQQQSFLSIPTTDGVAPFFDQFSFPPPPTSSPKFTSAYPSPPPQIMPHGVIGNDALFPTQFSDTIADPLTCQSSPILSEQSAVCLTAAQQSGMVTPPMIMNGHNYYHPYSDMLDHGYAYRLIAEENKRRRNTAASARFRIKKKMREQALEKTSKDMSAKAEMLENKVRELEKEIKWLKCLIIEKDASLLDIERPKEQSNQN